MSEWAQMLGVSRSRVHAMVHATPGLVLRRIGRAVVLSAADRRRVINRPRRKRGPKPRSSLT